MSCKSSNSADDRWAAIPIDLDALHKTVCEVFRVSPSQCGPAERIGPHGRYSRVFTFQLPSQKVVARLVYPIKPLFKTEGEVAAMDFVRAHTSLPVPRVFAYCSNATNPVGTEWLIMEHMPGVEVEYDVWRTLGSSQRRRLGLDLIDLHEQLSRLKADGCGSVYHSVGSVDDFNLQYNHQRSLRWGPLSPESLSLLKTHCNHAVQDGYSLGPLNDISLVSHYQPVVPSPSQTLPVFTAEEYFRLIALNGNPSTRDDFMLDLHEKCIELFQGLYPFYPNSRVYGPSATNFCFSHGDLHGGNILIDPQTGAITGIIDWELAAFRPLWTQSISAGWFDEDAQRFHFKNMDPENFSEDSPQDAELRAFYRVEMYKTNPDLFSSFLGAVELRAILDAAADVPLHNGGQTDVFLWNYKEMSLWNADRRGPFMWDMAAYIIYRIELRKQRDRANGLLA